MKFTIFQESRVGRRSANQDRSAYCYSRDALLMVVADGMGGYLHGEIAAQIAVQYIAQSFQREARPLLLDPEMFLFRALNFAHHAILDYAFDKDLTEAPRTTAVACVVQNGMAWWAHVGDSRLYHLRRGRVQARTRDHSQVQLMMDQGLLDAAGAVDHPQRNRIFSCLGSGNAPRIDVAREQTLRDGDILALCSDGTWGPLSDDFIATSLCAHEPRAAVPRVLDEAERRAGLQCDNLTLLTMAWHDERALPETTPLISTQGMTELDLTTQLETFARGSSPSAADNLTEDEIERAIREINSAIQKFTK